MEFKTSVQTIIWLVIDGLAMLWILHMLFQIAAGSEMLQTLLLMANTLCG